MVIKKSFDCLKCVNWVFERKWYSHYRDIPCLIKEIESDEPGKRCPHFKRYVPRKNCPECGSKNVKHLADRGEKVCLECGAVIEEWTLTSHRGITKGRSR